MFFFRFTRNEIKHLYRIFKTECPSGSLTEEKFHLIFTSFFPWGDEPYQSKSSRLVRDQRHAVSHSYRHHIDATNLA